MVEGITIETPKANPFRSVSKWSAYEALKTYILGPILVPVRVILMAVVLFIMNVLCRLSILFWNPEKVNGRLPPLPWYRRIFVRIAIPLLRLVLAIMGVFWVEVKGKLVSREETPIVVSNHGTAIDGFLLTWFLAGSSPIMREESAHNPILGPLYKSVQAIFVKRTTKESRKQVVEEIVHRGTTPGYPYLLIFPEGTTTNGEAVVTFKNGAFIPGKPVQPIVLRYPNSHYDPHWTPEIAEANLFYRFLSQFVNHAEIEVLEPYTPNEEEKKNPTLYASNVQKYMAKHLGVPATTHSFQDALLLTTASKIYKRNFQLNFTIHDMIQQYGLKFEKEQNDFEDLLKMFSNIDKNRDGKIDYEEFKETIIELSKLTESSQDKLQKDEYIKVLFKLMDIDQDGFIDYKEFIMGVKMLERKNKKEDLSHLQFAFSVFDLNADNLISFEEFEIILQSANPEMNAKKISEMVDKYFEGVDKKGMSFEKFKSLCVKNPEIVKIASGVLFGLLKQTLKK